MQRMGIVRACSGAPGLSPPSPGPGAAPHSPLDAESQHNSIVTLQGLLALVCGTGVPHLTQNTRQRLEPGQDVSTQRRKQAGHWLPPGHCLSPVTACQPPSLETWLAKGMNGLQRVRLDTQASSRNQLLQLCLSQSRPAQHTGTKEQLSGSCFSISTPSQGSNGTAQLPLPLQRKENVGMWCPEQPGQRRNLFSFPKVQQYPFPSMWL